MRKIEALIEDLTAWFYKDPKKMYSGEVSPYFTEKGNKIEIHVSGTGYKETGNDPRDEQSQDFDDYQSRTIDDVDFDKESEEWEETFDDLVEMTEELIEAVRSQIEDYETSYVDKHDY